MNKNDTKFFFNKNGSRLETSAKRCECEKKKRAYLGMVMHLVLQLCVVMAFSSSSRPADFLSFFTRLLTAFSLHLSSPSAFFQPSSRLTIGGLKLGSIEVIIWARKNSRDPHRADQHFSLTEFFYNKKKTYKKARQKIHVTPTSLDVLDTKDFYAEYGELFVVRFFWYRRVQPQSRASKQRETFRRAAKTLPKPPFCAEDCGSR